MLSDYYKRACTGSSEIRTLVAIEDEYQAYRAVIATAIGMRRPHVEVTTARPAAMDDYIQHFAPHVVISSRPKPTSGTDVLAWVELSLDPTRRSKLCVGARYSEMFTSTLDRLLAVIDEAEGIVEIKNSSQDR